MTSAKLKTRKLFIGAILLPLILSMCLVTSIQVTAAGNTWYVNGTSGTNDGTHGTGTGADAFATIDYAVSDGRVTNGDTIIVEAGTYNENIDVDKSLTIKSASGAASTIVEAVVSAPHVFYITVNNVTIDGFTLTGAIYALEAAGIYLAASQCTIINNICGYDDSNCNNYGISLDSACNNTIRGNNCNYNVSEGIYLHNSSCYNNIIDNQCHNNSSGIY